MIDWVERKRAPDKIIGSRMVSGKPVRTRHFAIPLGGEIQRYGSIDDAANLTCAVPSHTNSLMAREKLMASGQIGWKDCAYKKYRRRLRGPP